MLYRNIVIDDLREFVNTPINMRDEVVYLKSHRQAMRWLYDNDPIALAIDNLWVDFDLGLDIVARPTTTQPFVNGLSDMAFEAHRINPASRLASLFPDRAVEDVLVKNTFIVTANLSMKQRLADDAFAFSERVTIIDPVSVGLINEQEW